MLSILENGLALWNSKRIADLKRFQPRIGFRIVFIENYEKKNNNTIYN